MPIPSTLLGYFTTLDNNINEVKRIEISNISIPDAGNINIPNQLKRYPNLEKLIIHNSEDITIYDDIINLLKIRPSLKTFNSVLTKFEHLQISSYKTSISSLNKLIETMQQNPSIKVQVENLSIVGSNSTNISPQLLSRLQTKNLCIKNIDLSDHNIEDHHTKELKKFIEYHQELQSINLMNNNISSSSMNKILDGCINHESITNINIENNQFSINDLEYVVSFISNERNNKLQINVSSDPLVKLILEFIKLHPIKSSEVDANSFLLGLAQNYSSHSDYIIKFLISSANQSYPFCVNSINKDNGNKTLADYYYNNQTMLEFLFMAGYFPRKAELIGSTLQHIANDKQSIHNNSIVRLTNFNISKSLKNINTNYNLYDESLNCITELTNLLASINRHPNNLPFVINNLSTKRKEEIFKKEPLTPEAGIPNLQLQKKKELYKEFYDKTLNNNNFAAKTILDGAITALKGLYIINTTPLNTPYTPSQKSAYSKFKYVYNVKGDKISYSDIVGAIKIFIDQSRPTLEEAKNLFIDWLNSFPIETIRKIYILYNDFSQNTTPETTGKSTSELVNSLVTKLTQDDLESIFETRNKISLYEIWKQNKLSELAISIYMACNEYGLNKSACLVGSMTQIASSLTMIDKCFIDDFAASEASNNNSITENNIDPFIDKLAKAIIDEPKNESYKKAFYDIIILFLAAFPDEINLDRQYAVSFINTYFQKKIKECLPQYNKLPTTEELTTIITKLANNKLLLGWLDDNIATHLPEHSANESEDYRILGDAYNGTDFPE